MACVVWWAKRVDLDGEGKLNEGRVAYSDSTWLGLAFSLNQLLEETAWCVSTGYSET